MENEERTNHRAIWIFVILALVAMCCCAAAITAVGLGYLAIPGVRVGGVRSMSQDRVEQTFEVGAAPKLEIESFAGRVTVRAGEDGTVRVVATKRAAGRAHVEQIVVEMEEHDDGVTITVSKPLAVSNASVDLEITAPADTELDLQTGAGDVTVDGLAGAAAVDTGAGNVRIDGPGRRKVHTGAGNVSVQGAAAEVDLSTGAGNLDYDGSPVGMCQFETGAGNIRLKVPDGLSAEVDLTTGIGEVTTNLEVAGQVSKREVHGRVGGGAGAQIEAHTGVGNISLRE